MTVTLLPSAKRRNIEASWFVYADAQLAATFPGAIDFRGSPFDEAGKAEWCEVWLVGPAATHVGRYVNPTDRAQSVVYMPQANIFVRPSLQTSTYRLADLRDAVAATMKDGVVIPVLNYAGDSSAVGSLIVRRTNLDQEIPAPGNAPEDLRMHAYSVDCDWIELYQP